jgi:sporulation protein YlmC with PRC-barrel domain
MATSRSGTGVGASSGGSGGGSNSGTTYGRVQDVILDSKHPKYREMGGALAINGCFYASISSGADRDPDETPEVPFAFQGNIRYKDIPLVGEIIAIESSPSATEETGKGNRKAWTRIVNVWNAPEHNASPNTRNPNFNKTLFGKGFKESGRINPLINYPGDFMIQGRQGQSIRFTGSQHINNPLTTSKNNGQPLILIANGQITAPNGFDGIIEDVNKNFGSLYFTGFHQVPLQQANTRRLSYNKIPDTSNAYNKPQVILNSGRLFLNAKEESILLSAAISVGINGKSVNIDADDYVCIDSKKIYLGEKARTAVEYSAQPVLLGKNTVDLLEDFIKAVENFASFLVTPSGLQAAPPIAVAQLKKEGGILFARLKPLRARLKELKSKKVFTE